MSAPHPRQARLVALSLTLYRTLLLAYPKRFRAAYATELARVFRDSLRAAMRESGMAGLARIWGVTLPDLLLTALAERAERTESSMPITRSTLYRATGLVSLTGVAVWFLTQVVLDFLWALRLLDAYLALFRATEPVVAYSFPSAWTMFAIGFIGLYAWLAARRGLLLWLPGAIVIATMITMAAGQFYWPWIAQAEAPTMNQQLHVYAYTVSYVGFPVIGLALLATAWMIRATPTLRGVARTLLMMGVVSAGFYFFTNMGIPSFLRAIAPTSPGFAIIIAADLIFDVVWLIGGFQLGRWLWRAGGAQGQPGAAPATPQLRDVR